MSKLFSIPEDPPDIRPALLSMSALMMILLPTLLLITTPQKLIGISLSMAGASTEIPQTPSGLVESLHIEVTSDGFLIEAKVRKTDVLSSSGDVERKTWLLNSWSECVDRLEQIKSLDPTRKRIQLSPLPTSSTKEVIHWMDTLQQDTLYPEVIIESTQ
jgi:hypothetical protein